MNRRNRSKARRTLALVVVAGSWCWTSAAPPGSKGITDEAVEFGQSACFSGPNAHLGISYRTGIEAAFSERNQQGGIHGRSIELVSLDDAYESGKAAANAKRFVAQDDVFAVVGGIGTPTAKRIAPVLREGGVPFVGILTGAAILRNSNRYPNIVNLRASYRQELHVLVHHMVRDLGKRRFGVIYQDDAFGRSVLADVVSVLGEHEIPVLAKSSYSPNTHAVHSSLFTLEKADLDAVLLAGSLAANVDVINLANLLRHEYVMANLSVVAAHDLYERLNDISASSLERLLFSEVVPDPEDEGSQLVRRFRRAIEDSEGLNELSKGTPGLTRGHFEYSVALEGYIVGRYVLEVLSEVGADNLTRVAFLAKALDSEPVEIDDWRIQVEPGTNAGSSFVRLVDLAGADLSSGETP